MTMPSIENAGGGSERPMGQAIIEHKIRARMVGWRRRAGLTQKETVGLIEFSESKIHRIEDGPSLVSISDIRALASTYGITDEERDLTLELARAWIKGRKTRLRRDATEQEASEFGDFEAYADRVRRYSALAVPDFLLPDTYDSVRYTERPFLASDANRTALRALQRVRARQLLGPDGPPLDIIIDEAALLRTFAAASQVGALHGIATAITRANTARESDSQTESTLQNPRVSIRIAPLQLGVHALAARYGSSMALGFKDPEVAPRYYSGQPWATQSNPGAVAAHEREFDELSAMIPSAEHTDAFVDDAQKRFS